VLTAPSADGFYLSIWVGTARPDAARDACNAVMDYWLRYKWATDTNTSKYHLSRPCTSTLDIPTTPIAPPSAG